MRIADERLHPHWIYRVPNWRWQRAGEIEADYFRRLGGRSAGSARIRPCRDADPFVNKAVQFRMQVIQGSDLQSRRYRVENPDQYAAWKIHTDSQQNRARWELEARLLGKSEDEQVAERLCCSPEAVAWYERWFYHVRDRLENPGYIYQQLILPLLPQRASDRDYEFLWKFYGFKGGSGVLDSLIYGFFEKRHPTTAASIDEFWTNDYREAFARKAAAAAHLVPINWETQLELLGQRLKMLESDRQMQLAGAGGGGVRDTFMRGIQETMSQMPWIYEDGVVRSKVVSQIGSASLRIEEEMLAADHPMPDRFQAVLESAKFPPKAERQLTHAPNPADE